MQKRQLTVIGIVLITVTILFAISSFHQEAQTKKPQTQDEEATVVQRGEVTKKERDYSKEYKKLYPDQTEKLVESIETARSQGIEGEVTKTLGIPSIPSFGESPTAMDFLRNLSCKADAVVLGSVKSKASHLTEDETWVYTEYDFLVKSIVKDNSNLPIEINNTIEITRPGGLIKFDDRVVRVKDRLYDQLEKNKEYLLFLKFVPTTKGYRVSSAYGDFVLEDNSLTSLSKIGVPEELRNTSDYQIILDKVRDSVSKGCIQRLNGGN